MSAKRTPSPLRASAVSDAQVRAHRAFPAVPLVALKHGHRISEDQPELVVAAIRQAASG
jgi:hypothetical protein